MCRHPGISDPLGATAVVNQAHSSALAFQGKALGHRIDQQALGLGHAIVFPRIDCHDPLNKLVRMFDSVRSESTCRKNLESIAVEERRARIFSLFVELVSQRFQTRLKICLHISRSNFQGYAEAPPTGRRRQQFHNCLSRRYQEDRFLGLGETSQNSGPPPSDFARRLQAIKGQRIQPGKYQHVERRVQRVQNTSQPLRPVLVFSQEYQAVTAGPPLLEEVDRQHADRRG
jgi:hypothetical protein